MEILPIKKLFENAATDKVLKSR